MKTYKTTTSYKDFFQFVVAHFPEAKDKLAFIAYNEGKENDIYIRTTEPFYIQKISENYTLTEEEPPSLVTDRFFAGVNTGFFF